MAKREVIKRDLLEVYADLPEICYSRSLADGSPVILKRGVQGFFDARPGTNVEEQNDIMGISVAQEEAMKCGSIAGFHVPGADPMNYTDPTTWAHLEADREQRRQKYWHGSAIGVILDPMAGR